MIPARAPALAFLLVWPGLVCACHSSAGAPADPGGGRALAERGPGADSVSVAGVTLALDELYEAFCFDAGSEPDWATQRRLFSPRASFLPPLGAGSAEGLPPAQDTDEFLAAFREFATSSRFASTGFHERILDTHIAVFGRLAQARVLFEGYVPGMPVAETRGVDFIQLVHDGAAWRLVSFATQYQDAELILPERF